MSFYKVKESLRNKCDVQNTMLCSMIILSLRCKQHSRKCCGPNYNMMEYTFVWKIEHSKNMRLGNTYE